jgi:hypothetical protein
MAELRFEVRPIAQVESALVEITDAPNQGQQGTPRKTCW